MRKNILAILSLFVILIIGSCDRVEVEPRDWIREDLLWDRLDSGAVLAGSFLNGIYNYLPGGFNRIDNGFFSNSAGDFLDAGSGDAIPSRTSARVRYYFNGQINALNNPDPYWGQSYAGIRRVNIFLANVDRVPAKNPLTIPTWKAEARYIRALLYFELMKRYGGVPLVGDQIFTYDQDLQIPRNTYEECVNYVISECNAIISDLRKEPISDTEWGRIPKGAAIALKCRVYLYAASPLFNGEDVTSNPAIRVLTGYPAADPTRWQKVIEAAEELKALGYYKLQDGFASVFTTKKNVEVILARQEANNSILENNNTPVGYNSELLRSLGLTSPTQDLVDAFPMKNGLSITDPASGYDPNNPYKNRDTRLDATVFYNGMLWLKRNVETFDGGKDKPDTKVTQTLTGYYLKKFLGDFSNNTTYTNQSHNFIIFRYAEILLNYAEALNEVNRIEDAAKQIMEIRKRAGIAAGGNGRYGVKSGLSQSQMRDFIRNERRIELAFEEHRFWDLRRWKVADKELNAPLYGMKIIKKADNSFSYQKIEVAKTVFQDRLYHMPLPYDETIKNLSLIQNEGW